MRNNKRKIAILIAMTLVTSTFTSINVSATENNSKETKIENVQAKAILKATGSRIYTTGIYNHISVFEIRVSNGSTMSVWNFYSRDTYVGYNYATNITAVGVLQASLNALGYRIDVDFKFGPKTHSALIDFQKKNGLSVDGIAGPNTWKKLNSKLPAFK